jgi:hypothetical protein
LDDVGYRNHSMSVQLRPIIHDDFPAAAEFLACNMNSADFPFVVELLPARLAPNCADQPGRTAPKDVRAAAPGDKIGTLLGTGGCGILAHGAGTSMELLEFGALIPSDDKEIPNANDE